MKKKTTPMSMRTAMRKPEGGGPPPRTGKDALGTLLVEKLIQARTLAEGAFVFPEIASTTLGSQQGFNHVRPRAMVVRLLSARGVLGSRREAECTQNQRGMVSQRRDSPSRSDLMPQGPSRAHRS